MAHLVKCTGFIPYNEVYGILRIADVFITLSITEVHPLSILEAMSTGIPVIGIDAPGINDVVEDKKNGLLSNLDIDNIIANLKFMVDYPNQRILFGENAKKTAELYNIKRTSRLLVEVFESFIRKSNANENI
jgi:glycosyltransferase involved in cell wall biosynthesis